MQINDLPQSKKNKIAIFMAGSLAGLDWDSMKLLFSSAKTS